MTGIILSIGDELVLGQTIDTNSAWLSQQLAAIGCIILRHLTIGDSQLQIESALRESAQLSDVVLISGGIGPTEDDLTRQALASVMNEPLELNAIWLNELEKFFAHRGRPMPPINRIQAMIPRGASMIFNHAGTAAGIKATIKRNDGRPCDVYVMPGVPKEMKKMFQTSVLPELQARSGGAVILSRTLHTFGLGESAIAERLGPLMHRDRNPSVGTTVSSGVVSLRINARFDSMQRASAELARIESECRTALGDLIYGQDEQSLQEVVANQLFEINAKLSAGAPFTVTTAESCTGGLLAKMLTDLSGSSAYFHRGFVTYSNEAKVELLGVDPQLIREHGAVSEEVAKAMSLGALDRAQAKAALAISGIAGPTGGTPTKPVGTVCIALAIPSSGTPGEGQGGGPQSTRDQSSAPSPTLLRNTGEGREAAAPIVSRTHESAPHALARTFLFPGDRDMIRDRSAKMALTMLGFHLLGKPMPF